MAAERHQEHGLLAQAVLSLAVLALFVAVLLWLRWPEAGGGVFVPELIEEKGIP